VSIEIAFKVDHKISFRLLIAINFSRLKVMTQETTKFHKTKFWNCRCVSITSYFSVKLCWIIFWPFHEHSFFAKTSKMNFSVNDRSDWFRETWWKPQKFFHPFSRCSLLWISRSPPNSLATIHQQHVWNYRTPGSWLWRATTHSQSG
jgi:hypothetical protein